MKAGIIAAGLALMAFAAVARCDDDAAIDPAAAATWRKAQPEGGVIEGVRPGQGAEAAARPAEPERAREPDRRRLALAARLRDLKASLTAGVVDGVYRGRMTKKLFGWESGDGLSVHQVDVDDEGVSFVGRVIEFEVTWRMGGAEGRHHHRYFYRGSKATEARSWRGIEGVRRVRYVAPGLGPEVSGAWERCRACVALETRREVTMISFSSQPAMKKFTSALQSFLDLVRELD